MTIENEKSPAPQQASDAANQRPSKENATAESIVGVRAAGGNGTSSKVGRAEALTYRLTEFDVLLDGYQESLQDGPLKERVDARNELRLAYRTALLAAPPVEQPAAAPIDDARECLMDVVSHHSDFVTACKAIKGELHACGAHDSAAYWQKQLDVLDRMYAQAERALDAMAQPAPAPADERAEGAKPVAWLYYEEDEFIRMYDSEEKAVEACEKFGGHWMPVYAAASHSQGTTMPPIKGVSIDGGYVIVTPAGGRANAPAVKNAILALSRAPAQAAEPVAIPAGYALVPIERSYDMRAKALIAFNTTEQAGKDRDDALDAAYRAELAAAPQPAQADARVGLTDEQIMSIWRAAPWPDRAGVIAFARALLSAHSGQPQPRAEVTECCNHTWASCHKGDDCEFRIWLAAHTGASS
ncbi:hypothetical protein [Burkholderia cepacia]|uniref:hypothetical protein n=1 Tax=Burkholderia cepacia TaxID=292 RepID=UPI003D6701AA